VLAFFIALFLPCSFCAHASAQTMLGSVAASSVSQLPNCSSLQQYRNLSSNLTTCWEARVSLCPNVDDISFYYGIAPPAVGTSTLGTIVMLSGDGGGKVPGTFATYVNSYTAAGYQVVEVVWGGDVTAPQDWENVNTSGGGNTLSILNAACRPATVLNWIRNGSDQTQVGQGIWKPYQGGMCVHADSGGAGAVGFALAWFYGGVGGAPTWGGGYIDKAVLQNGPVFSDVEQGCEFQNGANAQHTFICNTGDTEPGCGTWPVLDPPGYSLEYVSPDNGEVDGWSQDRTAGLCSPNPMPACASNITGHSTCAAQNQAWYNQSIVNFPSTGQRPSFSYPSTALSGWSCSAVTSGTENNSAAQGQLFFQQFQNAPQTFGVASYNGAACDTSEDVFAAYFLVGGQSVKGSDAITDDMLGNQPANPNLSCKKLGDNRLGS